MFKRRGGFKVAKGVRLNYGKRGLTSATIAGVNIGGGRRRGGARRGPTKTQILADNWRLKPGFWDVSIRIDALDPINLVVDGGELTFARMDRIKDGQYNQNYEAVARAFKAFVRAWDLQADDGKPLPINTATVQRLGVDLIFGLAVEVANALDIPKKRLDGVLSNKQSGNAPRTTATRKAAMSGFPPPAPAQGVVAMPLAVPVTGGKSTGVAYVLWLLTGLLGGHRYYLGRWGTGLLQTVTLGGVGVWWLIDLFLVPGMVKAENSEGALKALGR